MNSNLKWLLLIPVLAVAIALGYLIPTQLLSDDNSGDENSSTTRQASQALQIEMDNVQERIDAYERLLEQNPNDMESIKGLADGYLEIGTYQADAGQENESFRSYKNAVDNYRKYLAVNPGDNNVRKDLGLVYSYLQMTDVALRELRAVTAADPTNQRAWHSLGYVLYFSSGNVAEAREAWTKSYNLSPTSDVGVESKSFLDKYNEDQLTLPQS